MAHVLGTLVHGRCHAHLPHTKTGLQWSWHKTPVGCEIGPISQDLGESSRCNSIINKIMIEHLLFSQLLEHFGDNKPRNQISEERTISHRLFRTIQECIENKFFDSFDIAIECPMHENELISLLKNQSLNMRILKNKQEKFH